MADDVKKPQDEKPTTENKPPATETPTNEKPTPANEDVKSEKPTEVKPSEAPKRQSRPPNPNRVQNAENPDKGSMVEPKPKPKATKEKSGTSAVGSKKAASVEKPNAVNPVTTAKSEPETPTPPPEPTAAPRTGEQEQIVYINLSELHPFKDHPFQVKQDAEMTAMVESVKDKGVTQPAIVRPREDGGYELVSGHRRHLASELSNFTNMPCIVRNLTDEQAITQMVEDNTTKEIVFYQANEAQP